MEVGGSPVRLRLPWHLWPNCALHAGVIMNWVMPLKRAKHLYLILTQLFGIWGYIAGLINIALGAPYE